MKKIWNSSLCLGRPGIVDLGNYASSGDLSPPESLVHIGVHDASRLRPLVCSRLSYTYAQLIVVGFLAFNNIYCTGRVLALTSLRSS